MSLNACTSFGLWDTDFFSFQEFSANLKKHSVIVAASNGLVQDRWSEGWFSGSEGSRWQRPPNSQPPDPTTAIRSVYSWRSEPPGLQISIQFPEINPVLQNLNPLGLRYQSQRAGHRGLQIIKSFSSSACLLLEVPTKRVSRIQETLERCFKSHKICLDGPSV